MKKHLLRAFMAAFLLIVTAVSNAQVSESRSCAEVLTLLESGTTAQDVVRATMATGLNLSEAAVYAMVCGGESNRNAIATAGIELASNLPQAQSVANALLAAAGQTGPISAAVAAAMKAYIEQMPQPNVHEDEYSPTGTGVSPAV